MFLLLLLVVFSNVDSLGFTVFLRYATSLRFLLLQYNGGEWNDIIGGQSIEKVTLRAVINILI